MRGKHGQRDHPWSGCSEDKRKLAMRISGASWNGSRTRLGGTLRVGSSWSSTEVAYGTVLQLMRRLFSPFQRGNQSSLILKEQSACHRVLIEWFFRHSAASTGSANIKNVELPRACCLQAAKDELACELILYACELRGLRTIVTLGGYRYNSACGSCWSSSEVLTTDGLFFGFPLLARQLMWHQMTCLYCSREGVQAVES